MPLVFHAEPPPRQSGLGPGPRRNEATRPIARVRGEGVRIRRRCLSLSFAVRSSIPRMYTRYSAELVASIVKRDHRESLYSGLAAGVTSEALWYTPSHLKAWRTVVPRAGTVGPMVVGREVATRPPQDGYVQIYDGRQHIPAESVGIGERRLLVEDAALNTTAQMLNEVSVDLSGLSRQRHARCRS